MNLNELKAIIEIPEDNNVGDTKIRKLENMESKILAKQIYSMLRSSANNRWDISELIHSKICKQEKYLELKTRIVSETIHSFGYYQKCIEKGINMKMHTTINERTPNCFLNAYEGLNCIFIGVYSTWDIK